MLKKLMIAISLLTVIGSLTACNTMEGVGEDIESAGDSLKDSAREHN